MCSLHCISKKGCQAAIFNSRTLICKLYEKAMMNEVTSSSATELVYLVTVSARNMVSPVSISNIDVLLLSKHCARDVHVFKFLLFHCFSNKYFLFFFTFSLLLIDLFFCEWIRDFQLSIKFNLTFFQIVYDTLQHIDL